MQQPLPQQQGQQSLPQQIVPQQASSQQPVLKHQILAQQPVQQQYTLQTPPVTTTQSTAMPGKVVNHQQDVLLDNQQLTGKGKGDEQGVNADSHVLKGSSSAGGPNEVQVEIAMVQTLNLGAGGASQKIDTTKMCRRCGVKGHLMSDCTAMVFCDICKSPERAMSQCPMPN